MTQELDSKVRQEARRNPVPFPLDTGQEARHLYGAKGAVKAKDGTRCVVQRGNWQTSKGPIQICFMLRAERSSKVVTEVGDNHICPFKLQL